MLYQSTGVKVVKTLLKTTELYLFSLYWQKSLKVLSTVRSEIIPKKLITNNQHSFMKQKSCTTNLTCYTDFITKTFDNKTQMHTIYTDFRRAFYTVPHNLLLHKLNKQFGIEGKYAEMVRVLSFSNVLLLMGLVGIGTP